MSLDQAVPVCQRVLDARAELDAALRARDDWLRGVYRSGEAPGRQVGRRVRAHLRAAGWTDEQLRRARLSDGNVKRVLGSTA